MVSAQGFVLSTVRYGDHDAVLHCFTQDKGYQSFFCRGQYSPRRKNRVYLQPLSEISFIVNNLTARGLPNISRLELLDGDDIPNVKDATILFFIADVLNSILRNEEKNLVLYREISALKKELSNHNNAAHLAFLIRTLVVLGFAPLNSTGQFLNLEEGIFEHSPTHHLFNEEISLAWKTCLTDGDGLATNMSNASKRAFLDSILLYYQVHFPGFRMPVSLPVVQEVFT